MKGNELTARVMLALSDMGCLIWRNNIGQAIYPNGSVVKYGVGGPGGSDIIGLTKRGRFIAFEIKGEGDYVKPSQQTFIDAIKGSGGLAAVIRSVDEAVQIIQESYAN